MAKATTIVDLVQGFAKHIKELKRPEYKESSVRLQYIDPFWRLLGWDVENRDQLAPQDVEVLIEPSMDSVEDDRLRSRQPDYVFRANGFPRFVVEAKKPAVDLDEDRRAIFQAKRYAWNATIPFAILTDFEQFRVYDSTLKPILAEPARGLVKEFSFDFQDYPSKWREFVDTFGRDAVVGGSLERLRARIRKVSSRRRLRTVDRMLFELRGDEPVDRVFLDYLEKYRQHLASSIYHDNKEDFPEADTRHGAARLTEAVQRLIDRLVFMRVCEDRGIASYGGLRNLLDRISAEGGHLYQSLCAEFRERDREYNGYLFKYHFSEALTVSEDVLADLIRTLYPPDGPWDFSAIGDDILGIVYERFLGNLVTVKRGHAVVEEKPEVRHAGGVYYTPSFVVDTIIRRVIGPQIKGKTPIEILNVRILDPACGSGSFLVATLQYLFDHCEAAINANPMLRSLPAAAKSRRKPKEIAFQDSKGVWRLAPDFKAALLTNCLHGVDIDQQAVEVTVMSLYLKMLEGGLPPHWQRDWLENQLLPPLDSNILCGNSLIDSEDFDRYVTEVRGDLFPEDEDIRFRINRFDWGSRTRGFGEILDPDPRSAQRPSGFDCILGNPPYIRVQELNKWAPDECDFYKWRYRSARKGNYDIYVVFVERCLDLLAPDGLLGFIMPHKYWQAQYGQGLREIVTRGQALKSVLDFGDQQVFRGATTYTAIQVFAKRPSRQPIEYAKVIELTDGVAQCRAIDSHSQSDGVVAFPAPQLTTSSSWVFANLKNASLLDSIRNAGPPLAEYAAKIFVGLQTSSDRVFILEKAGRRYFSKELNKEVGLESTWLHPLLKGSVHIRRWVPDESSQVVLFPYKRSGGKHLLVSESELSSKSPLTWKYLLECRSALATRERGSFEGASWYGYVYPKNLQAVSLPKILTPSLARRGEFAIDRTGGLFFVGSGGGGGGGYGIIVRDESTYDYVLGLLNSRLLNWFLQQITTPFHSGWFAYNKQFIGEIPVKLPKTREEKALAEQIGTSAMAAVATKEKLRQAKLSDRERRSLESELEQYENRIDKAVFKLYGVSPSAVAAPDP